jgi:hypothetical protein
MSEDQTYSSWSFVIKLILIILIFLVVSFVIYYALGRVPLSLS